MTRLQAWCALMFGWLFVLYNTERLYAPINLASFVYLLALVLAVAIVVWPPLHRVPLYLAFVTLVPLFLLLKFWLHYPLRDHLPITVTEICALWVTVVIARQIGHALEDVRRAVAGIFLGKYRNRSRSFKTGQREVHREMRRARTYRRPLALLAIAPSEHTLQLSLNRFIQEVQQEIIRDYAKAQLAGLLAEETKACDIIMHRNEHFVTLLPETSRDEALAVARKLEAAAYEQLGLKLNVGLSTFPEEEITFVKLLERAEQQMHTAVSNNSGGTSGEPEPVLATGDLASATL